VTTSHPVWRSAVADLDDLPALDRRIDERGFVSDQAVVGERKEVALAVRAGQGGVTAAYAPWEQRQTFAPRAGPAIGETRNWRESVVDITCMPVLMPSCAVYVAW
jgi:hypothetical protein